MHAILSYLGIGAISPEWLFAFSVIFYVLACLEIMANLLERGNELAGRIRNPSRPEANEKPLTTFTRELLRLPVLFVLCGYLLWVLYQG